MKALLLYRDRDFEFPSELPRKLDLKQELSPHQLDLVQDLELVTLFNVMSGGDRFLFEVAMRVMLASLDDASAIVYRQHVLADCLAQPDLVRELYNIATEAMEVPKKAAWGWSSHYPASILAGAVRALEMYLELLKRVRLIADQHTSDFQSEGFSTLFRTLQLELDDQYFEAVTRHLKQLRFKNGVTMSAELGSANIGVNYVLRSPGSRRTAWRERIGLGTKNAFSFTIPPRDEAGAQAVAGLEARGLNLVANAAAQSADHIKSFFAMLRLELGFYVGCLNVRDRLVTKGETLCVPRPLSWEPPSLSFTGLGDVCLSLRLEKPVVGNSADVHGKSLLVITGPNSGGKSTFLRSIGLAQLMMQAGMFVTAESFEAGVAKAVFTHFIREEDPSMTRGRLDEELSRMGRIADEVSPRSLMLFNESFAGTNEREGSEIGRQVVRALLESNSKVIYVTHLYDLAESFRLELPDTSLFMRAERSRDGLRTYKLVEADPLPTSNGEDLYYRIFEAR
ncbi:MAG: DNA mismatch repair protein MutS [Actinomycetota bacterium]|nr:DNA mismatch repair protein MutS [Actinomycetota bacterium]